MTEKYHSQIEIFQSQDGEIEFSVNVFEETVWLTQKQMSLLFDKDLRTINEHIKNCFKEGEISNSTIRNFRIVQKDIIVSKQDQKAKNRIVKFLKELGDNDSKVNKILKGAGISQKIIKELLKLFNKFKDFI